MLNAKTFPSYMQQQADLGNTITDTLRAYGLNIAPPERTDLQDPEDLTDDERTLSNIAKASLVSVIMSMGERTHPEHFALQGLLIGLAIGYAQGLSDGAETPFDSADTFPAEWTDERRTGIEDQDNERGPQPEDHDHGDTDSQGGPEDA